jgi:hypothetical protein
MIPLSTLTANIRTRRGSKVAINLPVFFDEKTPRPFIDPTIPWNRDIYPEDPGVCPASCSRHPLTRFKRPKMVPHSQITYIWTRWGLEWAVVAYSSPFKHVT